LPRSQDDDRPELSERRLALLDRDTAAEELYTEVIRRLDSTGLRFELARAQLLYGEWLRRQRRCGDARRHLTAVETAFEAMDADGFADRADRAILATRLFISPRTVEYHLSKVFAELGIRTRGSCTQFSARDRGGDRGLPDSTKGSALPGSSSEASPIAVLGGLVYC